MNRQKKLLLLLAVLVLASAVTLVVVKREEKKEIIKNTPASVLEWSGDALHRLHIRHPVILNEAGEVGVEFLQGVVAQ